MFDDIWPESSPLDDDGISIETGVYSRLTCDGGCGKIQTFKQTKLLTIKWKCADCCNKEDWNV